MSQARKRGGCGQREQLIHPGYACRTWLTVTPGRRMEPHHEKLMGPAKELDLSRSPCAVPGVRAWPRDASATGLPALPPSPDSSPLIVPLLLGGPLRVHLRSCASPSLGNAACLPRFPRPQALGPPCPPQPSLWDPPLAQPLCSWVLWSVPVSLPPCQYPVACFSSGFLINDSPGSVRVH